MGARCGHGGAPDRRLGGIRATTPRNRGKYPGSGSFPFGRPQVRGHGRNTPLPGLPVEEGVRLSRDVSPEGASRHLTDQGWQDLEHPRWGCLRRSHSQLGPAWPNRAHSWPLLPESQFDRGEQLRGTVKRIASKALKESSVLCVAFLSAESSYGSCCPEHLWVCRFRVRPKSPHARIQQSPERRPVRSGPRTVRVSTATPT